MPSPAIDTRAFLALSPDPCAVLDREELLLDCNAPWEETFGASGMHGEGLLFTQILRAEDNEGLRRAVDDAWRLGLTEGQKPLRFETRCRLGPVAPVWLQVHLLAAQSTEGPRMLVQVRDLTASRSVQEDQQGAVRQFERLLDQAPMPVWLADRNGERIWCNRGWLEFTGRVLDEELGSGWLERVHGDDLPGAVEQFTRGYRSGRPFKVECRVRNQLGEPRHVMQLCHPRMSSAGLLQGYIGVCVETESMHRAEAERDKVMQRVLVNQKLESLGVLAGGVAHDFGNLLMAVLGNADVALLELDQPADVKTRLEAIRDAATQAGNLCRQLLTYSGRTQPVTEERDLNGILAEFEHLLRTLMRDQASLEMELEGDLPKAECDPTQIRQIAMNLVRNAIDAGVAHDRSLPAPGRPLRLVLRTGSVRLTEQDLREAVRHDRCRPGPYVFFEVEDNGPGIPDGVVERIFEPFWSGAGSDGHGLGLAAVQGIVRAHRGVIMLQTGAGEGSRFRICLPAVIEQHQAVLRPKVSQEQPRPHVYGNTATALLVDDNPDVRRVGTAMLGLCGFRAETVSGGEAALDIIQQADKPFALVVLDLSMPGLSGIETLKRIRQQLPKQPVLIASGNMNQRTAGPYDMEAIKGDHHTRYLAKPYRLTNLRQSLKDLLGANTPDTHLQDRGGSRAAPAHDRGKQQAGGQRANAKPQSEDSQTSPGKG